MRSYTLADRKARIAVDLQDFKEEIESAVREVMPDACVVVEKHSYTVSPAPKQGDAVRIGRKISRTALGKYCIKIPKLFCSEEVEKKEKKANGAEPKQERMGGHH